MPDADAGNRIWFYGHATVAIDLDGTRLLTDPLLGGRVGPLGRRHAVPSRARDGAADAILISHMHHDHLDLPSLRLLGSDRPIIGPRGVGPYLQQRGFSNVREVAPGETLEVGSLRVRATPANHAGQRRPFGPPAECLGFLVEGSARVYFAGDTDLFPEMAEIGPVDVALLPIAGWGPKLGPGHLDPLRAAQALRLVRPRVAVPIHWGTLAPLGMHLRAWRYLAVPPYAFRAHAVELAPEVEVAVLAPGEALELQSSGEARR